MVYLSAVSDAVTYQLLFSLLIVSVSVESREISRRRYSHDDILGFKTLTAKRIPGKLMDAVPGYPIDGHLWRNKTVPYSYGDDFPESMRSTIARAMTHIESESCVRFVPFINKRIHPISVTIFYKKGFCGSTLGTITDHVTPVPTMYLDPNACDTFSLVTHELMHALGFPHEQSRIDRDNFVQIFPENIDPSAYHNFEMINLVGLYTPYDYLSVVHYESDAFSKNKRPTILPKYSSNTERNYDGLSFNDVLKLNRAYKCREDDENCFDGLGTAECIPLVMRDRYCETASMSEKVAKCAKSCGLCRFLKRRPAATTKTSKYSTS